MTETEYQQQVDARSQQILQACFERDSHRSLWGFHAALACGGDPNDLIEITQGQPEPGPFNIIPGMFLLGRWENQIPSEAVQNIKKIFTDAPQQRGNTENHWLMFYAGNLLAAERWPNEPTLWNGLAPAAMHAEASRWILGMINRTATIGHYEYDSTGYHNEHYVPYLELAEYAQDPHIRHQAKQMVHLLLADMALEYFHGAYAGGHSREGNVNTWTQVGPGQGLNYLYFGDETFDPNRHCQGYAIPAIAAAFRPPALLARMALDRNTPHIVRKTKPPRAVYRHISKPPDPVRKYTYMSHSFALGSTQTGLTEAPAAPIDLTSWDLTWRGPRHMAKIVCNHPYRSAKRFSAFLPEYPQRAGRAVATTKPHLQVPDRLFGASPYERMMQHEGTLIIQYQIPEDDPTPYVNCFLPKTNTWCEQEGWILSDFGDFYVGLRIIGQYRWEDIHETGADGNWIDGWLLRVEDTHTAVILEVVEADHVESFDDFCTSRCNAHLDLSDWPSKSRIAVDTIAGHCLEMTYEGPHCINDKPINYNTYPLFDGPCVDAPMDTGKITFRHDGDELTLDFDSDPNADMLPMRVIG